MDLLSELISSFDPTKPYFRPTEIYNESWLIKLVLHQAASITIEDFPIGFLSGSSWFSEALLPTTFKARFQGDPLSESRTNADGVIGDIAIGTMAKADLELIPSATQFTVVEAKVGAPLSSGISNAKYFDQAARNIACMAEVMARVDLDPTTLMKLDFVVLAPEYSIEKGTFEEEMQRSSIRVKVENRVSEYEGLLDVWYANRFEPAFDQIHLHSLSWEDAIQWIGKERPDEADELSDFYSLCLEFK